MSPMMHGLFVALTLGSLATASPTTPAETTKSSSAAVYSISQVSEFDNIDTVPGVAVSPVGDNSIYQNLKWNGFSLGMSAGTDTGNIPGVTPQSLPNFIAFAPQDDETISEGSFPTAPSSSSVPSDVAVTS